MDSAQDQLRLKIVQMNDATFLTTLTNMGEYKRAIKDYEEGEHIVAFENDAFVVKTGGERVKIGLNASTFTCTCPSPVKCRHMLTAIMAISAIEGDNKRESIKTTKLDFSYLDVSAEDIEHLFGSKMYALAVKKYSGSQIEILRCDSITCAVNGSMVVFLSNDSISSAVCSCKKPMCEHKCLALLSMFSTRTSQQVEGIDIELDEKIQLIIAQTIDFLASILQRGVYSCNKSDSELCMFYSLNLSLFSDNLSKNLKSLSQIIDDVVADKMYIDEDKLVYHFCKALNLLTACSQNPTNGDLLSKLLGEHKTVYSDVRQGEFFSLGAYPFIADSGYVGVTNVLADRNGKKMYTLTSILPTIYDEITDKQLLKIVQEMYFSSSLSTCAGSAVLLRNFKAAKNLNLTVNDSTIFECHEKACRDDYITSTMYCDEFSALDKKPFVDYFEYHNTRDYILIPFDNYASDFDDENGVIYIEFFYGTSSIISEIDYNAVTYLAKGRLENGGYINGLALLAKFSDSYKLLTMFSSNGYENIYF